MTVRIIYLYPVAFQPNPYQCVYPASFLELRTKVEDRLAFIVRDHSHIIPSTKTKNCTIISKIGNEYRIANRMQSSTNSCTMNTSSLIKIFAFVHGDNISMFAHL